MGQLFEYDTDLYRYSETRRNMPKSARSRKSIITPYTTVTESVTVDSAFSEMSISDESELTDEGRLSRSLQSWMPDHVIVPIEPATKPKRELVYSGRLGKRPNLQRVPSDESLKTSISLLSCSSRETSPATRSSTAVKARRRRRVAGSRAQSAAGKETPKPRTWEDFANQKTKGMFDTFTKAQNILQMDIVAASGFTSGESEAFQMFDKDEQVAVFNAGLSFGVKLTSSLKRSDSESNVNKIRLYKQQKVRLKRTLSSGAKPQSKPINLEEIRQQKLKEKMALLQKQQLMRRRERSRWSIISSKMSSRSSVTSDVAPNTPSVRSLSPVSDHEPIQVWKGDREILEMDLRAGLTERVKKRITATTVAINRVTGFGEDNRMQRVVGRHEEFPHLVEEDYAVVPKIVQRIRISPSLSQVIKDDMKVRMGRPRYHEIRIRDLEQWNKNQKLDRSHRNLKVFNWLHSLREDDFDKDIEPYIQDCVPSPDEDVQIIHVEAADERDVKPLYLTKFDLLKPK